VDDKGKLTQKTVRTGLEDAKTVEDEEAIECFQKALSLLKAEAVAKKAAKEAQAKLDRDALNKYGALTEADVQALVLDDKWATTIRNRIEVEVNSLTLTLVARIQQLGERYAETVGALGTELEEIEARITGHLADMGVK
jgi:type I restriction enzyme M protein